MTKIKLFMLAAIIGIASVMTAQNMVDFEDLTIEPESHWNGSDNSGSFTSKFITFYNTFDNTYASWSGFAYTNETDTQTNSYENYSSASGSGANNSDNYAIAYVASDWTGSYDPIPVIAKIDTETAPNTILGLNVSLSAQTNLYIAAGDFKENKHWLKLRISAHNTSDLSSKTKDIILADYRYSDPNNGFSLTEWTYIDMAWAENMDSLNFILLSSDSGDYGLNVPSYFCLDNIGAEIPNEVPNFEIEAKDTYIIYDNTPAELIVFAKGGVQPYTFTWSSELGLDNYNSQSAIATPEETTTWTVTVTDAVGTSLTEQITVNVGSSMVNTNELAEIQLNYNPNGFIYLNSNINIDFIKIHNIMGSEILHTNINSKSKELNINTLPNGAYIVSAYYGNNRYTTKIIK